jgi:hypothetical protein
MKQDLKHIEELIKQGKTNGIEKAINKINRKKLKRPELTQLANLARRSGKSHLALLILSPLFRPDNPVKKTETELLEYSASLIRLGLIYEANKNLNTIDKPKDPRWYLYRAFSHFAQWDYQLAIEPLNKYINALEVNSYPYLVGVINLISSHIFVKEYDQAEQLVKEIAPVLHKNNYHLLLGNLYELLAQIFIQTHQWAKAKNSLDQSLQYLHSDQSLNRLFVDKWNAVLSLANRENTKQSQFTAETFRKKAQALNNWEGLRMIDYYQGHFSHRTDLLFYAYFGTPFRSLRNKFEIENPNTLYPDYFVFPSESNQILDMTNARLDEQQLFTPGQHLHKLLMAVCKDFYKPCSTPHLFNQIYPTEYYNPLSSPDKVYQLVKRFNQQSEKMGLELTISGKNKSYRLYTPYKKIIPKMANKNIENQSMYVYNQIEDHEFNSEYLCLKANINKRKAQRLIKEMLEAKIIEKIGSGKKTRYLKKSA